MTQTPNTKTVRLAPYELELLLGRLVPEPGNGGPGGQERRRDPRYRYHLAEGLRVEILGPEGPPTACRVVPRNISETGLAFIHGDQLAPGTMCRIQLSTWDGVVSPFGGQVVRCDPVRGQVHDVGVRFCALHEFESAVLPLGYNRDAVIRLSGEIMELAQYGAAREEIEAKLDQLTDHCRQELPDP